MITFSEKVALKNWRAAVFALVAMALALAVAGCATTKPSDHRAYWKTQGPGYPVYKTHPMD